VAEVEVAEGVRDKKLASIWYTSGKVEDFLTVKEAAKQIRKSPSTVRLLIRKRKMKAVKLAGKFGVYIIPRNELLNYQMTKMSEKIAKTEK